MHVLHFLPEFLRRAIAASIAFEVQRLGIPAEFATPVLAKIEEILGVQ